MKQLIVFLFYTKMAAQIHATISQLHSDNLTAGNNRRKTRQRRGNRAIKNSGIHNEYFQFTTKINEILVFS
jgi:hypothetical protein